MDDREESLFQALGGAKGVREAVHDMYDRVLADEELAPFFENARMERLLRMQTEFVASMVDGPVKYTGAELGEVHRGRGITRQHFSRFCGHLADALEARGVPQRLIDRVLSRLAMYSDKVTGSANVDG
jgi:hemoglobin